MKALLLSLGLLFFSHSVFAEEIGIPDPTEITEVTNAMFDVTTDAEGQFRFYFVTTALHDKCLAYLEKAETVYASVKASATEIDEDKVHPYVALEGSNYTFSTGDYSGETVFKVDSCHIQSKKLIKILHLLKKSVAKSIGKKLKK